MSCKKVRFYESTMNGKTVGKKCIVSAATTTKGIIVEMRLNLDMKYLVGDRRERRNLMKTSFIVIPTLLIVAAFLLYVILV
jgi:uncharacterized membrane protein affecting hemolysin expression